ncbi:MAG: 16S rRNA (cytosine(1402)-N(4))-methyltransferase [Myxococcales bacterium]|nr:16S rRNA (cytosine(1402)-N(4))-methyltransferase [Myxococcales bacterium]
MIAPVRSVKTYHHPVLPKEVITLLTTATGAGWIVDGTVGGGGHTEALLQNTEDSVRVLGIDRDPSAIQAATERLQSFGERVQLKEGRFGDLDQIADEIGATPILGILLDLGVSSAQLDRPERGFSFRQEGPLDMDMEGRGQERALEVLRGLSIHEFTEALRSYGDVPRPGTVARVVIEKIRDNQIYTTTDLAELVEAEFGWLRKGNRHPATRVFQALRMVVNDEVGELERALQGITATLSPGGIAVVISYHSVEDRIVKHCFRELGRSDGFKILTRKPIIPSQEETRENPRARSAKLRAIQRVQD